jgi:hypothetical protein
MTNLNLQNLLDSLYKERFRVEKEGTKVIICDLLCKKKNGFFREFLTMYDEHIFNYATFFAEWIELGMP